MGKKIKGDESELKEQFARELRIWLNQSEFKNQTHFSEHLGINLKTVQGYFQGKKIPSTTNLLKLKELTNLEICKQILNRKKPKNDDLKSSDKALRNALKVRNIIQNLNDELEFFKEGSPQDRKVFRDLILGEDVGYIITLLKALFDEDQFQNWKFFDNYEIGKKIDE